jgi:hypothetical protein
MRTLLAACLLAFNVFVAEYEFPMPAWHISQRRPDWLFPVFLLVCSMVVALSAVRAMRIRFAATACAVAFVALRGLVYPLLAVVGRDVTPAFSPWLAVPLVVALMVDRAVGARAPAGSGA